MVDKILIENGRAKGIRLADGIEVEAKVAVVCGASPQQLVLELTGEEYWHPDIVRKAKNLENHITTITWYTWALHERPKYIAEDFDPDIRLGGWITPSVGADMNILLEEVRRRRLGMWPEPEKLNLAIADWSMFDPTLAPPGKATILTEQFVLPAWSLSQDEWKKFEKSHADDALRWWQKFAPNMTWDNVIGYVPITPEFTARHARNYAPAGNWHILDLTPSQLGKFRPILELANITKFPIENLYPCSAAWGFQPGASSMQGYAAYKAIAEKFGLRKPWDEKERLF